MPFDLQHIVCAVDFSPHTAGVLRAGQDLARAFEARLSVFHAVTSPRDCFSGTAIYERGGRQASMLAAARQRLKALAAPLENTETHVAAGNPVAALSAYVRRTSAHLVVGARRGFSGIQRVLLGSVIERMARQLAKPLLVVGSGAADPCERQAFKKVVVACDAVDASTPAISASVAMARRFGAALHLLHAMELPVRAETLEPTDGPYGEVQDTLQQRLHLDLSRLTQTMASDLDVSVRLLPGPAVDVLPRYAAQQEADLLVVGVRPRHRWEQVLIGSTTEAALRQATCAVLTVPTTMI